MTSYSMEFTFGGSGRLFVEADSLEEAKARFKKLDFDNESHDDFWIEDTDESTIEES